jgi:HAD superfamily hydrolase (TIGR01509 family)
MDRFCLPPVQAVFFDLDGTLTDSEAMHFESFQSALATVNIFDFDLPEYRSMFGMRTEQELERIARRRNRTFDIAAAAAAKTVEHEKLVRTRLPADPALRAILERLRPHAALGVCSNARTAMVDLVLTRLGVRDLFAVVIGGDRVMRSKPDPEMYLKAAAEIAVEPSRCAVVEDTSFGIAAARAAGMFAVAVTAYNTVPQDFSQADLVVPELGRLEPG